MESNRFNLAPGTVLDQEFSGGAVFEGTKAIRLHNGAREYQSVIIPCLQGHQSGVDEPAKDLTNGGCLFPTNDATEILLMAVPLPVSYSEGSDIKPFVIFKRTEDGCPVFKISYAWLNQSDEIPSFSDPVVIDTEVYEYPTPVIPDEGEPDPGPDIVQILEPKTVTIDGTGKKFGSMLLIKLYREDEVIEDDVLTYALGLRFLTDSLGSDKPHTKDLLPEIRA